MRRSGADDDIIGKRKKCNFVFLPAGIFMRQNQEALRYIIITYFIYIYYEAGPARTPYINILNAILAMNSQRFAIISIYICVWNMDNTVYNI